MILVLKVQQWASSPRKCDEYLHWWMGDGQRESMNRDMWNTPYRQSKGTDSVDTQIN